MLELITPPLPEYLLEEDGVMYARELVVRDERTPDRFAASPLIEGSEGLSWHALVTGLETDRANMRARFETALTTADARQRARLSTALSACYSGVFGFRRGGPGRVGFDAWLSGLTIQPDRDRVDWDDPPSAAGALLAERGCRLVPFSAETGHVPVGHDLLLYLLAEVDPKLANADFAEVAHFDPDTDRERTSPYTLQAWCDSTFYAAPAHAHDDFHDVQSVVGFLNAILRTLGGGARFRVLGMDGEVMAHGPLESIRDLDDEDW